MVETVMMAAVMVRRSFSFLVLALCLGLSVSGCTAAAVNALSSQPSLSLANANYAAADMLAGQSRNTLSSDVAIRVEPIRDMNDAESNVPFGRVVSEQISARFVQLGYIVHEMAPPVPVHDHGVQTPDDKQHDGQPYDLTPPEPPPQKVQTPSSAATAAIGGTYALTGSTVLVNLRLTDTRNGRILAAYDYTLPMTGDVRTLTGTGGGLSSLF